MLSEKNVDFEDEDDEEEEEYEEDEEDRGITFVAEGD